MNLTFYLSTSLVEEIQGCDGKVMAIRCFRSATRQGGIVLSLLLCKLIIERVLAMDYAFDGEEYMISIPLHVLEAYSKRS